MGKPVLTYFVKEDLRFISQKPLPDEETESGYQYVHIFDFGDHTTLSEAKGIAKLKLENMVNGVFQRRPISEAYLLVKTGQMISLGDYSTEDEINFKGTRRELAALFKNYDGKLCGRFISPIEVCAQIALNRDDECYNEDETMVANIQDVTNGLGKLYIPHMENVPVEFFEPTFKKTENLQHCRREGDLIYFLK